LVARRGGRGRRGERAHGSQGGSLATAGKARGGLADRSAAPIGQPGATPDDRIQAIAALRRLRLTGAEIAECLGIALSTVRGILTRIGLGGLSRLEPPEPPGPL
jgi:Homeodomain-like domain